MQLRQDNLAGTLYNIVGFQTNLKWPEQKRVFRLMPGLAQRGVPALRHDASQHLHQFAAAAAADDAISHTRRSVFRRDRSRAWKGYIGNAASGLVAGLNAARLLRGEALIEFPATTMLGALCHYVTHADPEDFQPMKANYGILPPLENSPRGKRDRYQAFSQRALDEMRSRDRAFRVDRTAERSKMRYHV